MKYLSQRPWAWALFILLVSSLTLDAWAARLGGGRSMGRQSAYVSQRHAAPQPQPVQQPGMVRPLPATPVPMPAQTPAKKPWGGMLGGLAGGLAAGLGLSWLMHSMGGFGGGGFGGLVMVLGLVALGIFLVRSLGRRGQGNGGAHPWTGTGQPAMATSGAYGQTQTGAAGPSATLPSSGSLFDYHPANVGNDASARPWERPVSGMAGAAASLEGPSSGESALSGDQTWGIPADFDVAGFLASCKTNYLALQKAWSTGSGDTLRAFMDEVMWQETQAQLAQRNPHSTQQPTEVVMLDAKLLGIEELSDAPVYMGSVEFSGLIKEDGNGPTPFREVWNLTKAKSGHSGWLLAGIQVLN
jgi:predicted lipid-binding transport protein (Tim44 family)